MVNKMVSFSNLLFVTAFVAFLALSTSSKSGFDLSQFTDVCLNAQPIESNYTPTGTEFILNNMTVYETINKTSKRVIIAAYDIFGFHNNTKQLVDKLADGFGFKIAMPNYFRGPGWDENYFPPDDLQEIIDWLEDVGNWNKTVKDDTLALMEHYKTTENVTEFAIFGFCWGGYVSTRAATEIPELKAAGLVHPSLVEDEDAQGVQVPMYLLPSKDDPSMLSFYVVLQEKFGTNCGHRRFDDMIHGFASARGNFSDPLDRLRVDEVIDILGNFFDQNLDNNL